jgi:pilus assembly protein Flp/PilA
MLVSSAIIQEIDVYQFIKRVLHDESGATAIEYGLIAALIAIVIISAVTAVGTNLAGTFNNISGNVSH